MKSTKSFFFYLAVFLVIVSVLVQETEARRKILRGRKALTRNYYRGNTVPAWVTTLLVGIGMLIVGGVVYGVMRKIVLSKEEDRLPITYQSTMQNDA